MNKDDAKVQLQVLLERHDKIAKKEKDIKSKEEEMTKNLLIRPLFEHVLGWNFEEDVTGEEKISKGWVDYGFRIDDVPKFFLEAKGLRENLDSSTFFQQAYSYAYYKKCAWAVLTNFETIEIINAESEAPYNQYSHMTIKCNEFLDKFDDLWLLSKEGFEKGLLDKLAERFVRRPKRVTFDRQLLDDFTRFRDMLSKNIIKLNQKKQLTEEDLDESVQRILNRLIFIRNCEDRELEEKKLWEAKNEAKVWKKVKEVFAYYDKHYDSKLFTYDLNDPQNLHLCDKLDIEDGVLRDILSDLYQTKDRSVSYDFKIIPANVLGTVYEQYLSHILKKTEKRAVLSENQTHRKEQGIYYTPTYIVEYIVANTLGELLKDKKTNVEQTKILDPACGSGSFLIKAFDLLNEHYIKTDADYDQTLLDLKTDILFQAKARILQKNIFGVDLDKQAVEITQLNLLLKIAEKRHRLPLLEQNIKCGNSLIEDGKIAGEKAFKWKEQFKEILEGGGFDVVIGNPPYVRQEELLPLKPYLQANYRVFHSMADLFVYFFERGLEVLRENGYFGIIVSNKWFKAGYGKNLRKFLNDFWIEQFIDFGDLKVFQDATTYPCIIIIRKMRRQNPKIKVCQVKTLMFDNLGNYIEQNQFAANQSLLDINGWNLSNQDVTRLLTRLKSENISLKEYVNNQLSRGILTGFNEAYIIDRRKREELIALDPKNAEIIEPFVSGEEIRRYGVDSKDKYIILAKIGVDLSKYPTILERFQKYKQQLENRTDQGDKWYELRTCSYYDIFREPKIMFSEVQVSPKFTFDKKGYYANKTIFSIPRDDLALVGVLNSKLVWFLVQNY